MTASVLGLVSLKAIQVALSGLAVLHLTAYRFPPAAELKDNLEFDYVVIGGGTTGSIVASQLSEDSSCNVAIIEAGGDPPLETVFAGLFPMLPRMSYDYNYKAENDHYTSQHTMGNSASMTAGKLLGGTSAMSHTFYMRGNPYDFDKWAEAATDDSWNYKGMLPYFIKSERINDAEILNGPTADLHGTKGNLGLSRELDNTNDKYIESFKEIGFDYNPDVNSNNNLGISYPYHLYAENERQDSAESYLGPAKKRKNLFVFKQTTATKIIFDDDNNAIGVEVDKDSVLKILPSFLQPNTKIVVKARREVLLAAGVVKSPQLLMLSGIGPEEHLNAFDIPVLSDLPVGQNLSDRVGMVVAYKMEPSIALPPPQDPTKFPVPVTVGYKALDSSQSYPDYQILNLVFAHDSPGLLMLLSNLFKYQNDVADKIYSNNVGHELLLVAVSHSHPISKGEVLLSSKDPFDTPKISLRHFSDSKDLEDFAAYLKDFNRVINSAHFRDVGAEFVDIELEECSGVPRDDSLEFWKCYAVGMSTSFLQYIGSCSMGPVVDYKLRVRGVNRLRVVDASAVPSHNSGENLAAIIAFAEKAAGLIKEDY